MRVLVFGKTGQVATELARLSIDATFLGRDSANFDDPTSVASQIDETYDAVINAAAWTDVDGAESDEASSTIVNGESPAAIARACSDLGLPFVHISTDYVFDGSGDKSYSPKHPTGPIGAYGRSKLAGENGVIKAGGTYGILRTSWVFSAHGKNFVKTMLRLSETHDSLKVVGDQIGGPTSARAIAQACVAIAAQLIETPAKSGIYHFSGAPDVSWAGFAKKIFDKAGRQISVTEIPSSQYPTPAKRPLNSRMNCESLTATFGIDRPNWSDDLEDVIHEVLGQ